MDSNSFKKRKAKIDASIDETINNLESGYNETVLDSIFLRSFHNV